MWICRSNDEAHRISLLGRRLAPGVLPPGGPGRGSPPPMTGSPLAPLVVLSTAVRSKVVLGASVIVFAPPAALAALMSAMSCVALAAVA